MPAGVLVTPSVKGGGFVGVQKRLTIPAPAAGADFSFTFPGGAWWRLLTLRLTLLTSAVVASRAVRWQMLDGAAVFDEVPSGSTQAASITSIYALGLNRTNLVSSAVPNYVGVALNDIVIPGGYILRAQTINLDVGDQWSVAEGIAEEMDLGPFGGSWGIVPFDTTANGGEGG